MPKSPLAKQVDRIQSQLTPLLKKAGFRHRGRTFNRATIDGMTHVVNIQMGPFEAPAWTPIPGLRENMYGLFTVNLGAYIPEVARFHGGSEAKAFVQEYYCCIRWRLGRQPARNQEFWWHISDDPAVVNDLLQFLETDGLPYLDQFSDRDAVLRVAAAPTTAEDQGMTNPRIVTAVILACRGQRDEARRLLVTQVKEATATHPHHAAYVRLLAVNLGLDAIDY